MENGYIERPLTSRRGTDRAKWTREGKQRQTDTHRLLKVNERARGRDRGTERQGARESE